MLECEATGESKSSRPWRSPSSGRRHHQQPQVQRSLAVRPDGAKSMTFIAMYLSSSHRYSITFGCVTSATPIV
jgi:hypothetical protein